MPNKGSKDSSWWFSTVWSSAATKRMSAPFSLMPSKVKLPVCRRTSSGVRPAEPPSGMPCAVLSTVICLRYCQSGCHQAWAADGNTPASTVSRSINKRCMVKTPGRMR
ncbi:hypothetical protein G6F31_020419 [Rhizopus arrhizus]|nr:hypothetical protein G6F31_020419 [Rhizopus arrhizus]